MLGDRSNILRQDGGRTFADRARLRAREHKAGFFVIARDQVDPVTGEAMTIFSIRAPRRGVNVALVAETLGHRSHKKYKNIAAKPGGGHDDGAATPCPQRHAKTLFPVFSEEMVREHPDGPPPSSGHEQITLRAHHSHLWGHRSWVNHARGHARRERGPAGQAVRIELHPR